MNTIFLLNQITGSLTPISMLDIKEGDVIKVMGKNTGTYRIGTEYKLKTGGEAMKIFFPIEEVVV